MQKGYSTRSLEAVCLKKDPSERTKYENRRLAVRKYENFVRFVISYIMKKLSTKLMLIACGFFLFLDQWLKNKALHAWQTPNLFLDGWLGWEPFLNRGVAFSIPVPSMFVIVFTVPIIILLIYSLTRELATHQKRTISYVERLEGLAFVIAGALSNFIDRIQFHVTIDYFRVFTAIINIGDILIVAGFVVYFISVRKKNVKL